MVKARCQECEVDIPVPEDVVIGEIVTCPDCGMDYEVVKVKSEGVELKVAETTGEDWGE